MIKYVRFVDLALYQQYGYMFFKSWNKNVRYHQGRTDFTSKVCQSSTALPYIYSMVQKWIHNFKK